MDSQVGIVLDTTLCLHSPFIQSPVVVDVFVLGIYYLIYSILTV